MSRVVLVVGTGSIGMRHLRVLAGIPDVEPVAVPVREGRAEELRRSGFVTATTLADALARRPFAAVIATDTGRHLDDARRLLESGCHLLVEKPIAPSCAGLAALADAARDHRREIFVGYCLRFDAGLRRFRDELGSAGVVHHVRIECQSYLPAWRPDTDYRKAYAARVEEGGVLRDLSHEIDYACWLYGRPKEVSAILTRGDALEIEADAAADLTWRAPNGATISMRLDYVTRTSRRRMTAFGSEGEVELDAILGTVTVRPSEAAARTEHAAPDRDGMMRAQLEAFLRATSGGERGDLATLEEGACAVAVTDAAREASASGTTRSVPDWRLR